MFFFIRCQLRDLNRFLKKTMANDKKCVPGANPQPNKKELNNIHLNVELKTIENTFLLNMRIIIV